MPITLNIPTLPTPGAAAAGAVEKHADGASPGPGFAQALLAAKGTSRAGPTHEHTGESTSDDANATDKGVDLSALVAALQIPLQIDADRAGARLSGGEGGTAAATADAIRSALTDASLSVESEAGKAAKGMHVAAAEQISREARDATQSTPLLAQDAANAAAAKADVVTPPDDPAASIIRQTTALWTDADRVHARPEVTTNDPKADTTARDPKSIASPVEKDDYAAQLPSRQAGSRVEIVGTSRTRPDSATDVDRRPRAVAQSEGFARTNNGSLNREAVAASTADATANAKEHAPVDAASLALRAARDEQTLRGRETQATSAAPRSAEDGQIRDRTSVASEIPRADAPVIDATAAAAQRRPTAPISGVPNTERTSASEASAPERNAIDVAAARGSTKEMADVDPARFQAVPRDWRRTAEEVGIPTTAKDALGTEGALKTTQQVDVGSEAKALQSASDDRGAAIAKTDAASIAAAGSRSAVASSAPDPTARSADAAAMARAQAQVAAYVSRDAQGSAREASATDRAAVAATAVSNSDSLTAHAGTVSNSTDAAAAALRAAREDQAAQSRADLRANLDSRAPRQESLAPIATASASALKDADKIHDAAPAVKTGAASDPTIMPMLAPSNNPPINAVNVAAAVGSPQWAAEVSNKIAQVVVMGQDHAQLRLNPPQLGPVDVQVRMAADQATIVIAATHAVTRDALEQALPQLREALAQQGITLGQASVHSDAQPRDAQNQTAQQRNAEPDLRMSLARADAPVRAPRSDRLVDTFA